MSKAYRGLYPLTTFSLYDISLHALIEFPIKQQGVLLMRKLDTITKDIKATEEEINKATRRLEELRQEFNLAPIVGYACIVGRAGPIIKPIPMEISVDTPYGSFTYDDGPGYVSFHKPNDSRHSREDFLLGGSRSRIWYAQTADGFPLIVPCSVGVQETREQALLWINQHQDEFVQEKNTG